ncbi:MAG: antitoxin VapB family protein [Thermoplasmata archaeon]
MALTEDADAALARLKREGESFSEVVRRPAGSQILLAPFAGAWSSAPTKKVREVCRFLRSADRLSRTDLRRLVRAAGDHGEPG